MPKQFNFNWGIEERNGHARSELEHRLMFNMYKQLELTTKAFTQTLKEKTNCMQKLWSVHAEE